MVHPPVYYPIPLLLPRSRLRVLRQVRRLVTKRGVDLSCMRVAWARPRAQFLGHEVEYGSQGLDYDKKGEQSSLHRA